MNFRRFANCLFLLVLTNWVIPQLQAAKKVYIQQGILDLSSWNIRQDPILEIHGEWRWYQDKFIGSNAEIQEIPSDQFEITNLSLKNLDGQWGTLFAEVILPAEMSDEIFAIWMENFISNANLVVDNGRQQKLFKKGNPGKRFEDEISSLKNEINSFQPNSNRFYLMMHRSFFFQFVNYPLFFGSPNALNEKLKTKYLVAAITIGMLALISLYNLSIFSLHRKNQANLLFALAGFLFIARQLITSGLVFDIYNWQSRNISYLFLYSMMFGSFQAGFACTILALSRTFKSRWLQLSGTIVFVLSLPLGFLAIYSYILTNSRVLVGFGYMASLVTSFAAVPICIFVLIKNFQSNEKVVKLAISSMFTIIFAFIWDSIVGSNALDLPFLVDYGLVVMMFLQSQITGVQFAKAFSQAEHLSLNLQQEVDKSTDKLLMQKVRLEAQQLELIEAHNALKNIDQQKTQFFQNISHELRTPLTLILTSQKSLLEKYSEEEDVQIAERNSRRLLRLVNQLLDFQKQSTGDNSLNLMPINLSQFLNTCATYVGMACEKKSISLVLEGLDSEVYIAGELDALEKVIFNYLSNALKYTPEFGQITLGLAKKRNMVRIYVKDSGPGIKVADQKKLFQIFSQVDGTDRSSHEGTGLGLALVKELIGKMDGTVGIDSEIGQGALFWAELPITTTHNHETQSDLKIKDWHLADFESEIQGASKEDEETEPSMLEDKKGIAIVCDDVPDMRNLMIRCLKSIGFQVKSAKNGQEALELVKTCDVDLILTDWMMPIMTGPDLIRALHSSEKYSSIPTILLTARSDEESKMLGNQVGATAYLSKPFDILELQTTACNLVALKKSEKKIHELNRYLTETVLCRFLPPKLVKQVVAGEFTINEKATMLPITVLFCDLCEFTKISEELGPLKISVVLNEFFEVMSQVIFSYQGTIDKFMGDSIMVLFGAPEEIAPKDQIRNAIACAKELHLKLVELNRKWASSHIPNFRMRIALHHGSAVVGHFGSELRSEYTAIGPTINYAARMEAVTPPDKIFISDAIRIYLDGGWEEAGEFDLKGIGLETLYIYQNFEDQTYDKKAI